MAGAVTDEIASLCSLLPGAVKDTELIPGSTVLELLDGPGTAEATSSRAARRQVLRTRGKTFGVRPALYKAERLCMIRNVDDTHWYVIVADTGLRLDYILDSLGRRMEQVTPTDTRRRMAEVLT